tara:strand:- start:83 stop:670 length:588 start_codon:yes stop_codon:yes gene_type:complete
MFMQDFIKTWDNELDTEYCQTVIDYYNQQQGTRILNRQTANEQAPKMNKDGSMLYDEGETGTFALSMNKILQPYYDAIHRCVDDYVSEFGIFENVNPIQLSHSIKIQHTRPSEGYHVWHCEHASRDTGQRALLAMVYLNNVDQGGETEFLYQSRRIEARTGRVMFCPAGYTHTHRGNPPLSGDKYAITTWLEFTH